MNIIIGQHYDNYHIIIETDGMPPLSEIYIETICNTLKEKLYQEREFISERALVQMIEQAEELGLYDE